MQSNGFTRAESETFTALRRAGVVVVTVFAGGDNMTAVGRGGGAPPVAGPTAAPARDSARAAAGTDSTRAPVQPPTPPMVTAQHLTPAKARILLMGA